MAKFSRNCSIIGSRTLTQQQGTKRRVLKSLCMSCAFNSDIDIKILFSKVDSPLTHATFGVFCFCCTSEVASFQENQL